MQNVAKKWLSHKAKNPTFGLMLKLFSRQQTIRIMIKELRKENHKILDDPRIVEIIKIEELLDSL
jgi:hypothetical protein